MLSNALRRGLLIFTAISTLAAAPSTAASTAKHTTPTTTETRQLMDTLFSDFALDNFGQNFADALDDDLVWTVTGSSPIAGTYVVPSFSVSMLLPPSTLLSAHITHSILKLDSQLTNPIHTATPPKKSTSTKSSTPYAQF